MPYSSYGCGVCGQQAPKHLREHGTYQERVKWLRHHYMKAHPRKYLEWKRKSVKTRSRSRR